MDKYIDAHDFNITGTLEDSKTIHQHLEETKAQQKDFINAFSKLLVNALNNKKLEEL